MIKAFKSDYKAIKAWKNGHPEGYSYAKRYNFVKFKDGRIYYRDYLLANKVGTQFWYNQDGKKPRGMQYSRCHNQVWYLTSNISRYHNGLPDNFRLTSNGYTPFTIDSVKSDIEMLMKYKKKTERARVEHMKQWWVLWCINIMKGLRERAVVLNYPLDLQETEDWVTAQEVLMVLKKDNQGVSY